MSKVVELPRGKRTFLYRFFEILPFAISASMILLLVVLSAISSTWSALYLLFIVIMNVVKAVGIAVRTVQGHNTLKAGMKVDWEQRLNDLRNPAQSYESLSGEKSDEYNYNIHLANLKMLSEAKDGEFPKVDEIYHAIIVTLYNETIDVLEPTLQSVVDSSFDKKHMIVVIAYEERGGEAGKTVAKTLEKKFGKQFYGFILSEHPDGIEGEVVGKGANLTCAGRRLQEYVEEQNIPLDNVIVTSLDSDNRPDKSYFSQVAYEFIVHDDRQNMSYQPVSLFTNNIWDAPAVTRVVATTNSFWNLICTMRPHMLRNFASHSQSLDALVEMNFWSVRTIVEDGHQYWRSLFYFDGDYEVLPIRTPIYQDAVLSDTLWKTLKAQWVQLRRWDYGASDVAYVGSYMFSKKRTVKWGVILPKFIRLLDGHVTLAAMAPIIAFGGWVPLIFHYNTRDLLSHNLPMVVSYIQTIAAIGLFVSLILSLKMLPERPARYKKSKKIWMAVQWIIAPITAIAYSSFCAFYSQTRLLFALYMEKFDVTEKVVKK